MRAIKIVIGMAMTLIVSLSIVSSSVFAHEFEAPMQELFKVKVSAWLHDAVIVNAIKMQNKKSSPLSEEQIIVLDKQWRAEVDSTKKPLINATLSNELSFFLKNIQEKSDGVYTEIFVMDNKGLNVGQSSVTSDYWQGDEAKWKKTFLVGKGSVHIGKVKQDESTQEFQSQLSATISDPASGVPIGAITIGIGLDNL